MWIPLPSPVWEPAPVAGARCLLQGRPRTTTLLGLGVLALREGTLPRCPVAACLGGPIANGLTRTRAMTRTSTEYRGKGPAARSTSFGSAPGATSARARRTGIAPRTNLAVALAPWRDHACRGLRPTGDSRHFSRASI
jgi:hypothetical protein